MEPEPSSEEGLVYSLELISKYDPEKHKPKLKRIIVKDGDKSVMINVNNTYFYSNIFDINYSKKIFHRSVNYWYPLEYLLKNMSKIIEDDDDDDKINTFIRQIEKRLFIKKYLFPDMNNIDYFKMIMNYLKKDKNITWYEIINDFYIIEYKSLYYLAQMNEDIEEANKLEKIIENNLIFIDEQFKKIIFDIICISFYYYLEDILFKYNINWYHNCMNTYDILNLSWDLFCKSLFTKEEITFDFTGKIKK
jgi:hypothetical protein